MRSAQFFARLVAGLTICLLAGCNQRRLTNEDFRPSESDARQALDVALTASREPDAPQAIEAGKGPAAEGTGRLVDVGLGSGVKVLLVDKYRQPGQTLLAHEILGEVGGDGPRTFLVRLVFGNPDRELKVRYYVFGRDPLYALRQEDYDKFMRWDDDMKMESPAPAQEAERPADPAQPPAP